MKAILAGAGGLTGGHLARELARLPGGGAQVKALVRKPVMRGLPEQVEQVVCDFARLEAVQDQVGAAEVVFCALGSTIKKAGSQGAFRAVDYDAVMAVGRLGRACGARQFLLVSSVAADSGSWNFYLRVKAEAERDLGGLGYGALHIFRPSFLLGERGETRWAESAGMAVARAMGPLLAGSLSIYRGIDAAVVARAMVAAASSRPETGGLYHYREMMELAH